MNIIGEGFHKNINDQVIQRQKVYGSGYTTGIRTPEEILYLNANTSWCKLVSSVNINDPSVIQNQSVTGIGNISGNELAKKFVLFNGVKDQTADQRAGIDFSKSLSGNNNAYGIGGTDFGLRPMMGIKSAEIKHENRGSLRRATVQIKAWNKTQFDIIDILYLRLGFDILLEWGHTMWYDNSGELHTGSDTDFSLAPYFLSGTGPRVRTVVSPPRLPQEVEENGDLTYEDFLKLIQKQRLNSYGNYDAMFAKVTNYHWSFLPDGSYDITLDLVSIGDVIESFKINVLTDGITNTQDKTTSEENVAKLSDDELIPLYANRSSIGQWFYTLIGSDYKKEKPSQAYTTNEKRNTNNNWSK